jgi:hypothetical protein
MARRPYQDYDLDEQAQDALEEARVASGSKESRSLARGRDAQKRRRQARRYICEARKTFEKVATPDRSRQDRTHQQPERIGPQSIFARRFGSQRLRSSA